MTVTLEIIAATVEDALQIEAGGADRIELVAALCEGGLTPSYGMIEDVVSSVRIPVNVMIRPHAKSFRYTKADLTVMRRDIAVARQLKANGVVFGALDDSGRRVDERALYMLLEACEGLDVTFHRAIDEIDPVEGIKVLAKYPQLTNVLTSGGKGKPQDHITVLRAMREHAGEIRLLVGGGLTRENLRHVMEATRTPQIHLGTSVREDCSPQGEIDLARLAEMVRLAKL